MTKRFVAFLLGLGLLLPIAGAGWSAEDEENMDLVSRVGETRPVRTKVFAEDYVMVEGKSKASTVKIPSYKVSDVLRADRPYEYDRGVERLKEGRFAIAAKYFTDVLRAKDHMDKPWVIEYCNYHLATAMFDGEFWDGYQGKTYHYSEPSVYFDAVLKANPKSRFLLDVSVKVPICLVEQKKFAEAEKAFVAAAAAIKRYRDETAKTADLEYRAHADRADAMIKLGGGKLLEKKGDFAQAVDAYATLQRVVARKFPDIYSEAWSGELRCLAQQGRFSDARARAESLIKRYQETNDPSLLAMLPVAHAVMGWASLALAAEFEAKSNAIQAQQAYSDARWNYLQVLVRFFDRDEHVAEASYYVGLCYDKLKGQETTGKDLAIRYWLNVKRSFPDSSFAKLAQQDLARVGGGELEQKK